MKWPPYQHPSRPSPLLDTALVIIGALAVALVAAVGQNTPWLIASGLVAVAAVAYYAWLENR